MARPQKYTVDYFPHLCKQGKTMYILEARYGNDGYAFWFKLLEILATTRGHYFDASDPIQLEFLGAKTRLSVEKTELLLGLLASIDAIDKGLWQSHKLIWSENLVRNVTEVYENRSGLLPEKPYYQEGKLHQNIDNHNINLVSSTDNTQTKLNYTKLDKTKLNNSFNIFWSAYPKKKSRGQAERTFIKINPDEKLLSIMLSTIEKAKKSATWSKENGQFIPYPATWLNAKGWEDEYSEVELNGTHQGSNRQVRKPSEYSEPDSLKHD